MPPPLASPTALALARLTCPRPWRDGAAAASTYVVSREGDGRGDGEIRLGFIFYI